jgi:hypothetical protein
VLNSPVWRGTPAVAFCVGLVAGGVLSATVLVVVGSLVRVPVPTWARLVMLGGALTVIMLREVRVVSFALPESRRLVPETVFRLGRHLGPLQFGLEMGTGARTYLPSGLPYVAGCAVLLLASVPAALCLGAGFGLGRALMTTSNLRYGDDGSWNEAWLTHGRLLAWMLRSAFVAALSAVALTALR